jgi:hypothetical protein
VHFLSNQQTAITPAPVTVNMSNYKNTSPAKKLRGIKRMLTFLKKKSQQITDVKKSLAVSPQQSSSFSPPKPNLATSLQYSIDIPFSSKNKPELEFVRCSSTTVPPRHVYHPAIINAAEAFFGKHPGQLEPDEVTKFNLYRNRKLQIGEPLETEIIYQPIGGTRTCVNCGELT